MTPPPRQVRADDRRLVRFFTILPAILGGLASIIGALGLAAWITHREDLTKLLEIDRDLHAPAPVRFNWGPMEFAAVIEKLGRKVTKFHPDGTPARATLTVSFKEYRTLRQQIEDPRRESADKTKRRVVVGRDSLWALAAQEYGDPNEWVRIAEANDLDDPREISSGDWLELPPIENPNGTRGVL